MSQVTILWDSIPEYRSSIESLTSSPELLALCAIQMRNSQKIHIIMDQTEIILTPEPSLSLDAQIRTALETHFLQENNTANTTDSLQK